MAPWLLAGVALTLVMRPLATARRPTMDGRSGLLVMMSDAVPSTADGLFEKQLAGLRSWRGEIGHADVPLGSALGRWVYAQRRMRADGRMPEERVAALEALGFRWRLDPDDMPWEEMVERFTAFYAANGHGRVPKKYVPDPLLGAWVALSRRRNALLSDASREQLTAAGFDWAPPPSARCGSQFMLGFRAWVEAKRTGDETDAKWEAAQRAARRKGMLSDVRVEYLDGAGFEWEGEEAE